MANLLTANLPSEDEEDETFDPEAEAELDKPKAAGAKSKAPSRRGLAALAQRPDVPAEGGGAQALVAAKSKAKAASHFDNLRAASDARQRGTKRARSDASASGLNAVRTTGAAAVQPGFDPDADWKRLLGFAQPSKRQRACKEIAERVLAGSMASARHAAAPRAPLQQMPSPAQQARLPSGDNAAASAEFPADGAPGAPQNAQPPDGEDAGPGGRAAALAAADAALAAVKGGALHADAARKAGMVTVVETRRFAGKDVEMATEVKAGSKAAENVQQRIAAATASTGLDAVLHNIQGPRKANVMDKTADDWKGFKTANTAVDEELHVHGKSGDKYLERKAFLQKAELSEYEQQKQGKQAAGKRT